MLKINADDWGRSPQATDRALACFNEARISSASFMVFNDDSLRAAELAKVAGIRLGLHLNLTETFSGSRVPDEVLRAHHVVSRFLTRHKFALLIYNPFLQRHFHCLWRAQFDEFVRLIGNVPCHVDGHQHMHLCTNILFSKLIPSGYKVRRSFTFEAGEKNTINRWYRKMVDKRLASRYCLSDYFFNLPKDCNQLRRIAAIAEKAEVELMVHPERDFEYDFLMSDRFLETVRPVFRN